MIQWQRISEITDGGQKKLQVGRDGKGELKKNKMLTPYNMGKGKDKEDIYINLERNIKEYKSPYKI